MRKQVKQTGQFVATDGAGQRHTVCVFTEFLDAGVGPLVEGIKLLKLADGTHVNRADKGNYETVGRFPELALRSDDPNAV